MSKRLMLLLTVAGAMMLTPAFNDSATVQAKDWEDRWEDYQDAREDYWEDREDYYEDLYDNHRRHRVRYRSGYRGYPAYGWTGGRTRIIYRSPMSHRVHHGGVYRSPTRVYGGYYPVGTAYHGHCHY